jgi:hypothetical protein
MIEGYHPHTVRASRTPLYLMGLGELGELGQDPALVDTMSIDPMWTDTPPPAIDPTMYEGGSLVPNVPSDFYPNNPLLLIPSGADLNLQPSSFDPAGNLLNTGPTITSNQQDIANLYAQAVASGTMKPGVASSSAVAAAMKSAADVTKAASAGGVNLAPGPSPRVGVPAVPGSAASVLTQQSIPGVPNWALFALAAVAALAMGKR